MGSAAAVVISAALARLEVETGLVTTETAAGIERKTPAHFRVWARRRDLHPARLVRVGRANVALWDMNEVFDAVDRPPEPRRATRSDRRE